jgi:PAS domain S-box-containing protein
MGIPLQALIIEDSEDDALLLVRELERGGYIVTHERADTADGMIEALENRNWDIVFGDYSMPRFSGTDALRILREKGFDIPFIFVSGTMGEEIAVSAMQSGAQDYIVKGNFRRLIPAIERELRDAEVRKVRLQLIRGLRESEERYKVLAEAARDIIFIIDRGQKIRYINDFGASQQGRTPEEVIGKSIGELLSPDVALRQKPDLAAVFDTGKDAFHELKIPDPAGREIWGEAHLTPLRNNAGEIYAVLGIMRDITKRKKAEEALRRSEERFKRLVESVTNYIYTVKIEGGKASSTKHGPGCFAVTGYMSDDYDDDPGLWLRMVHEADRPAVAEQANRMLIGGEVKPLEHRILHKNGSIRWVRNAPVPRRDELGKVTAYDGLITDITQRKKLEEQLSHAQKMEAIGLLAGGIAHDFNNILGAIIGFGNIIDMKTKDDDPNKVFLKEILDAGDRATNLAKSLLTFSRKQIIELKSQNLNDIVKGVEKFLWRIIGEDIEIKSTLASEELTVMVDRGQIEQVLMNLATNAKDAMPGGGSFFLTTGALRIDGDYVKRHGYGEPGKYALLTVTDTGSGMDDETRERIFEPFFTTKDIGMGTGLGLSLVYGIIKQHDGFINVYSETLQGTTFKIYLPLINIEAIPDDGISVSAYPEGGSETLLVAEDDPVLRRMTADILGKFGYKIITAEDGEDALGKFMENKEEIRLLVLDVIMPKKNGKELYDEIKKIKPSIRVIFLSGYTSDLMHKKGILRETMDLLLKPVSPKVLLKKTREVLDRPD